MCRNTGRVEGFLSQNWLALVRASLMDEVWPIAVVTILMVIHSHHLPDLWITEKKQRKNRKTERL
jgi:hypothetical protein